MKGSLAAYLLWDTGDLLEVMFQQVPFYLTFRIAFSIAS